jgi:hypothetical protein
MRVDPIKMSRREVLLQDSAAFAGLALLNAPRLAQAFPSRTGEEVIPFLDQPPPEPPPGGRNLLKWEELNSWITPNAKFFRKNGQYQIVGAAWGAPIQRVEAQIDGGPWMPATLDRREEAEFAWKIWSLEWEKPSPAEHTTVSRAVDTAGNIQPAMDDPRIAKKRTYWESNGQVTRRIRLT